MNLLRLNTTRKASIEYCPVVWATLLQMPDDHIHQFVGYFSLTDRSHLGLNLFQAFID